MIEHVHNGSIFDSGCQALVNPVNCRGAMGKGLAKAFKERFEWNFAVYLRACQLKLVKPGRVLPAWTNDNRVIYNFPTKRHWRDLSRLDDVLAGLDDLVERVKSDSIESIAIPALGCGLGGLTWDVVCQSIIDRFRPLESVRVRIYWPSCGVG